MKVSEAVVGRRSIRAFLDKPVERELLMSILDKARNAPSGGNVQPWNAVIVAGDPLQNLLKTVGAKIAAREADPEYDIYPPNLPDPYRSRRFQSGEALFGSLGIAREDRIGRLSNSMKNFTGFGAPVMLFCHTPAFMGKPQWSDLGMWLQTIMLLLKEEGLDSCPQEAWSMQGKTIKSVLEIPQDHSFFCGLAIGYAHTAAPVNNYVVGRAPLEEMVRFEGF